MTIKHIITIKVIKKGKILNVNLKIILKFMSEVINFELKSNQTEKNYILVCKKNKTKIIY